LLRRRFRCRRGWGIAGSLDMRRRGRLLIKPWRYLFCWELLRLLWLLLLLLPLHNSSLKLCIVLLKLLLLL